MKFLSTKYVCALYDIYGLMVCLQLLKFDCSVLFVWEFILFSCTRRIWNSGKRNLILIFRRAEFCAHGG
ncbi:hypothetical protein RIF29_22201 [Crotalaria pallida]|uniref:Uncharacterized protein n=1 Tax=Crotalaria pallida TaxID=3830 RepID=A0AAN9F4J9_CROPI